MSFSWGDADHSHSLCILNDSCLLELNSRDARAIDSFYPRRCEGNKLSCQLALINGVGEAQETGRGKSRYSDTDNGFFCRWPARRRLCRVVTWPQSLEVMGKQVSDWVPWVISSQWGSLGQLICFHSWISRQQPSRKGNAILLYIYFCNL